MTNLYFKITHNSTTRFLHSEYDDNYIKWMQERIYAESRYEMQQDPETLKEELKLYNAKELSIFGIFLFADQLLKIPDDKDTLEKLSLLTSRTFEVLDSIENAHGFIIDLELSDIKEMDFDEVTNAILNCKVL